MRLKESINFRIHSILSSWADSLLLNCNDSIWKSRAYFSSRAICNFICVISSSPGKTGIYFDFDLDLDLLNPRGEIVVKGTHNWGEEYNENIDLGEEVNWPMFLFDLPNISWLVWPSSTWLITCRELIGCTPALFLSKFAISLFMVSSFCLFLSYNSTISCLRDCKVLSKLF